MLEVGCNYYIIYGNWAKLERHKTYKYERYKCHSVAFFLHYVTECISPQNVKVTGCILYWTSQLQNFSCYKTSIARHMRYTEKYNPSPTYGPHLTSPVCCRRGRPWSLTPLLSYTTLCGSVFSLGWTGPLGSQIDKTYITNITNTWRH
jgi:hypothetical protein